MREHQQDYWLAFWCTKNYGIKKSKNRRPSAREGDPQPLTVVAADLKAIGAPAAGALIHCQHSLLLLPDAARQAPAVQARGPCFPRRPRPPPPSSLHGGPRHPPRRLT